MQIGGTKVMRTVADEIGKMNAEGAIMLKEERWLQMLPQATCVSEFPLS